MTTTYDEVAYRSLAFPQTSPDVLATQAALFGLPYAPIDTCRLLDIGGGDGMNAIAMAVAHPRAHFVSFDLSQVAVARGQEVIAELGLTNIDLSVGDITQVDFSAEPFDYVVAHGIYSWIPDFVRDAMMGLIKRSLKPNGLAFVSYNALPGCRMRQMIRDILVYQVRDIEGGYARLEAARRYLQHIIDDYPQTDPLQAAFKTEALGMLQRPDWLIAHDELGPVYHPVALHEFEAHARAHGLKFLTEAEQRRAGEGFLPPRFINEPDLDIIAHCQEMDFRMQRPFRQSLVVHAETGVDRRPYPTRLLNLHVSTPATRNERGTFSIDVTDFEIRDHVLDQMVERLSAVWPATIPVADLVTDEQRLGALLKMFWVGTLELHVAPTPYPTTVSARPAASPLARRQARLGEDRMIAINLEIVETPGGFSRDFIAALDGSRDHEELARDAAATLGVPVDDSLRRQLATNLAALARMPLLVA